MAPRRGSYIYGFGLLAPDQNQDADQDWFPEGYMACSM